MILVSIKARLFSFRYKSEDAVMDREKVKEIVSILMESPLYFDLPLIERMELIRRLISMVHFV
jgi:hypothetical protein